MEHRVIRGRENPHGVSLGPDVMDKLVRFSERIHEHTSRYNLTGIKDPQEILNTLVLESLDPVLSYHVPRGTRYADIGSGAGIPGIPLAIFFPDAFWVLVESQGKKARFIRETAAALNIRNVEVLCGRAEEIGREPGYRESFDGAFSRASGHVYAMMETGLPFVKREGFLYIYSNMTPADIDEGIRNHGKVLGAAFISSEGGDYPYSPPGLLLKKHTSTPGIYPRRFAVIERESKKYESGSKNAGRER